MCGEEDAVASAVIDVNTVITSPFRARETLQERRYLRQPPLWLLSNGRPSDCSVFSGQGELHWSGGHRLYEEHCTHLYVLPVDKTRSLSSDCDRGTV